MLGQVNHSQGAQLAHLSFLAPESALDSGELNAMLDYMIQHLGHRGALHLLAEVDERTIAFEALRKAGFALYVRQRIWQFAGTYALDSNGSRWRAGRSRDVIAVRSLYNTLVPGLAQQVEPVPSNHLHGLVYEQDGEILAYAEVKYGARGIWIQPFIHPDVDKVMKRVVDLLARLAKETGADFLIAGKLVMFGDTVNIDATLYRLPIIQPVSAVFVQGQGLNSLIPKINELAVGIIRELKTATSSALPALRAGWSGSATGPGKRLSRRHARPGNDNEMRGLLANPVWRRY